MSVPAPRLLEAVTKSIKHATAMSTILATELFQTRRDAALATSKNSCYDLRNAPITAKTLFGNMIKEVAKGNFEAQQQRFLASSALTATSIQQQNKMAYSSPSVFKRLSQLSLLGLRKCSLIGIKSYTVFSSRKKDYPKRNGISKQFPFFKPASSSTKF